MPEKKPGKARSRIAPSLPYHKAMALYAVTGGGQIFTVEECPAEAFAALVEAGIPTARNPEIAGEKLAGLDYRQMIDRWYAINLLRESGATIPLFATLTEATQHQGAAAAST